MLKIANLSNENRKSLFQNTAAKMNKSAAIVEKDFWVCFMLDYLFNKNQYKRNIVFKGGTSLSKAYDIIERFSEDIDIVLDWEIIGYSNQDLWQDRSKNKQNIFNENVNYAASDFIKNKMMPSIEQDLKQMLNNEFKLDIDEEDPMTIEFKYPNIYSDQYIKPIIRLEIGPLASWTPTELREITSDCANQFMNLFKQPSTLVRTVTLERAFWEKITILHKEANKGENLKVPNRYSRHYYDVYRLVTAGVMSKALKRKDVLKEVITFKNKFYYSSYAHYEEILEGQTKLIPPKHLYEELRNDYNNMSNMIYGKKPSFEALMVGLKEIEKIINKELTKTNVKVKTNNFNQKGDDFCK